MNSLKKSFVRVSRLMKKFLNLLLFNTFFCLFFESNGHLIRDLNSKYLQHQAIHDVIHELFIKRAIPIEVSVYGELSAQFNDTIQGLFDFQPLILNQYEIASTIARSSIVFVDENKFQASDLKWTNFKENSKILFYVDGDFDITLLSANLTSFHAVKFTGILVSFHTFLSTMEHKLS